MSEFYYSGPRYCWNKKTSHSYREKDKSEFSQTYVIKVGEKIACKYRVEECPRLMNFKGGMQEKVNIDHHDKTFFHYTSYCKNCGDKLGKTPYYIKVTSFGDCLCFERNCYEEYYKKYLTL